MKQLYIDNKLVYLGEDFDPNMTFRFLDTYNPSAVKTSYSKTITLPNCPQNAAILGTLKARYPFELRNELGLLEKGYCTLDKMVQVGNNKYFNVTLYGGLGDFFYNLKGDDSSPKTLADLLWTDVTGLDPELENNSSIIAWSREYVYNSWTNPQGISDVFRPVPCIFDSKNFQTSKTIVPWNTLFEVEEQEGSEVGPWTGEDGTEGLLVEAEENTCYGKQDFRIDQMPLGIKYQEIIKACCKPENNGGYTVTLDPDFFSEVNPYWTNMFLLKKTPAMEFEYIGNSSEYSNFTASVVKVGNFQGSGIPQEMGAIVPGENNTPWLMDNQNINLAGEYSIVDNVVSYRFIPFIIVDGSEVPSWPSVKRIATNYITWDDYFQVKFNIQNVDTGDLKTIVKTYPAGLKFPVYYEDFGNNQMSVARNLYVNWNEALEGKINLPANWTHLRFYLQVYRDKPEDGFELHYGVPVGHLKKNVPGDVVVPVKSPYNNNPWEITFPSESYLKMDTNYIGGESPEEIQSYTKKDLLGGTKTPFDYLVWFTKMFNLRFYIHPGTKEVEILTPKNYLSRFSPLDIQDRVCYDREYSTTRKIVDEGFILFNLTPDENETVKEYQENVGEGLLDYSYPLTWADSRDSKEYLSPGLRIGTKARNVSDLAEREVGNLHFYGFNQQTPYSIVYPSGSGDTTSEERSLNYILGSQRYDFLTVNNLEDVVVMYSGLKETPFEGGPAIISTNSNRMLIVAGGPCYLSGISGEEGSEGSLLDATYTVTYQIPHYGLVPSLENYDYGLTYSNVDYKSIIASGNIYDKWFKDFIERVYQDPLVVECYVRLVSPELRRLYWFDNNYWILTEVSNYNYKDEPVKCKFIRYKYDA